MANYRAGNAFASSFMQGFSFVDTAMANRRREAMLAERLEEEKKQREFTNSLATQQNERAAQTARRQETTFRQNLEKQELLDESNARFAEVGGDITQLTDEELANYATVNPQIQAAINQNREQKRRVQAVRDMQELSRQQTGAGLSESVAAQGSGSQSAPLEAANEASESAISLFEPAESLQTATADEIRRFRADRQDQGVAASVGNFFEDAGDAIVRQPELRGGVPFPADRYTSQEELDAMEDPAQIQAAVEETRKLFEEAEALARRPQHNTLAESIQTSTRQTAIEQGAVEMSEPIQQRINEAVDMYDTFVNEPQRSKFNQLASESPARASQQYFETRNTVDVANPDLAKQVDRRMVPVLDRYEGQLVDKALSYPAGSRERLLHTQTLRNVQKSRAVIAGQQPSAAQQAEVHAPGLKIGDTQRVQNVNAVLFDPERPRVPHGTRPASNVRAATTVVNRISPSTTRLSDRQIESLLVLADENMIDAATAQTVMMTGQWPPGKDPNSIKAITSVHGYAFGELEGGGMIFMPEYSKRDITSGKLRDEVAEGDVQDRTFSLDKMNTVIEGARIQNPNMTDEMASGYRNFILDYAPRLRGELNLDSEENLLLLGKMLAQSDELARDSQTDGLPLVGWFGAKDREMEEIFFSPQMRVEYAVNFEKRPVRVSERMLQQDWDTEAIRSELLTSGVLNNRMSEQQIKSLGETDLAWIAVVLWGSPDQMGD